MIRTPIALYPGPLHYVVCAVLSPWPTTRKGPAWVYTGTRLGYIPYQRGGAERGTAGRGHTPPGRRAGRLR